MTSQSGKSEALANAAGIYAVLCCYADGSVLMTVEDRDHARLAREKFITDMVEPAGFTEDDLRAHLRSVTP